MPTGAGRAGGLTVCLTVDAEPDCPPYLEGWRGMEEGAPILLSLLRAEGVAATFFTTGETARRHPGFVAQAVAEGHELGCHAMTHRALPELTAPEVAREIETSTRILRRFAPVTSFRAPYLRLPEEHLPLLEAHGYRVDSSRGWYKPAHWRPPAPSTLRRLPASVSSSWLRLPRVIREPLLRGLRSPVVLFVHPWEFVDLREAAVPWDCRAGTGARAGNNGILAMCSRRSRRLNYFYAGREQSAMDPVRRLTFVHVIAARRAGEPVP